MLSLTVGYSLAPSPSPPSYCEGATVKGPRVRTQSTKRWQHVCASGAVTGRALPRTGRLMSHSQFDEGAQVQLTKGKGCSYRWVFFIAGQTLVRTPSLSISGKRLFLVCFCLMTSPRTTKPWPQPAFLSKTMFLMMAPASMLVDCPSTFDQMTISLSLSGIFTPRTITSFRCMEGQ